MVQENPFPTCAPSILVPSHKVRVCREGRVVPLGKDVPFPPVVQPTYYNNTQEWTQMAKRREWHTWSLSWVQSCGVCRRQCACSPGLAWGGSSAAGCQTPVPVCKMKDQLWTCTIHPLVAIVNTQTSKQLNNAAIRESVSQVQGRDDIKMKVNIQSLIPTSFYTTVAL